MKPETRETEASPPGTDEAMELLTCLPCEQTYAAPIGLLAGDLGYATQAPVRRLLAELSRRGFKIETCHLPCRRGHGVFVPRQWWRRACVAGEAYLNRLERMSRNNPPVIHRGE